MVDMKSANEKTTIYLDPKVKQSVRYYALRDRRTLSDIINQKLFEFLEEQADIAALDAARADGEESVPFDQVVAELGLNLHEIRRKAKAERKKAA